MKTNMKLYNILFQVYIDCSKKETEDFIEKTKEEQEMKNPFQELE